MTEPDQTPTIDHHRTCSRPKPLLWLSWKQEPEIRCTECGRTAPAPDERKPR